LREKMASEWSQEVTVEPAAINASAWTMYDHILGDQPATLAKKNNPTLLHSFNANPDARG